MPDQAEPNLEQIVPFFWVRDIQSSADFYVDSLGFTLKNRWIDKGKMRWCWLQRDRTALMLQELAENAPEQKLGAGFSITFVCRDAIELYRELRNRNVDAKRPFVGNAMWVTEVSDPDGYNLLFESPTDAEEETVFLPE